MPRRFGSILDVSPAAWDALVPGGDPFLSYAFLAALERSGCAVPETGWKAFHMTEVAADGTLSAAAPVYLKGHSHGEFVYDWRWAAAYEQAGGRYYPKLFVGPPFTPATGARLLGDSGQVVTALIDLVESRGLSSIHVNCVTDEQRRTLADSGFLHRALWQYHWYNRGYRDFDEFLSALKRKRRKNIRQERRRLARTGWQFRRIPGAEAESADWALMHRFYRKTFMEKGNWPTLSAGFFNEIGESLARRLLLVFAFREDDPVAGALFFQSDTTLYGRYWGAFEDHRFLHFETCYYQGIEYAIEAGLERFEPGAQGAHKIPRGFEPVEVHCAHYFRDPMLRQAVAQSLRLDRAAHDQEGRRLAALSAYP